MKRKFEKYALANGFDWNNVDMWYTQPRKRLLAFQVSSLLPFSFFRSFSSFLVRVNIILQGIYKVISHYRGSIPIALADLFPAIKFDISRFQSQAAAAAAGISPPQNNQKDLLIFVKEHGTKKVLERSSLKILQRIWALIL